MSAFNEFTKAFDDAVNEGNIEDAATVMAEHLKAHSEHTGKPLSESFDIVRAWMGYDMGENREASTRHTEGGQKAIEMAQVKVGIKQANSM